MVKKKLCRKQRLCFLVGAAISLMFGVANASTVQEVAESRPGQMCWLKLADDAALLMGSRSRISWITEKDKSQYRVELLSGETQLYFRPNLSVQVIATTAVGHSIAFIVPMSGPARATSMNCSSSRDHLSAPLNDGGTHSIVSADVSDAGIRVGSLAGAISVQSDNGSAPNLLSDAQELQWSPGTAQRMRLRTLSREEQKLRKVHIFGTLSFEDTALEQVVAEINRFNGPQLRVADPTISTRLVSGTFRADRLHAVLRLLMASGIRADVQDVTHDGTTISLSSNTHQPRTLASN